MSRFVISICTLAAIFASVYGASAQQNWETGSYATHNGFTTGTTTSGKGVIETQSGEGWGRTSEYSTSSGRSCISSGDGSSVSCSGD
jgi:hypothetical protein